MEEKAKNGHEPITEVYELAGLVERWAANIIDGILLSVPILLVLQFLLPPDNPQLGPFINFIVLAIPVIYHWYFWTKRDGQTPGKFALGIRVIKTDGGQLGDVDAVIRAIGYHVSGLLFGLGYIWAFFDKRNQAWHDKMARTYVVRADNQRKIVEIEV